MKQNLWVKWLPAGLAAIGAGLFAWWWLGGSPRALTLRVPGADRTEGDAGGTNAVWAGKLTTGSGKPAALAGAWPQFRGANHDAICTDPMPLLKNWPATGPKALWQIDVGEGFAAATIWKGRVFLTDYDRAAQLDVLRCLSLADGQEIWRYTYPSKVKRNHGMSRTIPAVTETAVISLGPKCQLIACDPLTGELRWRLNLVREFNTEVPPWYAGQCPLVDGDRLILGTGGDALLVAVDVKTGAVLWKSPNPRNWQMTHSSITPFEFGGRRMYAYCASGGVAGVAADTGEILWETTEWKISIANIPCPVPVGDGKLFFSGGYNAGSAMLQLKPAAGKFTAVFLFRLKPNVFGATQQTPIFSGGNLFGVRPDGQLVCLGLDGKVVWESGVANKYGNGPLLIAQGLLFVMDDEGTLTLAEASPAGFKKLAQARVLEGQDAWGPLALADGRLIARDLFRMICLDVAAR